jgi:type I restriction enzyme, S subunit
MLSSVADRIMVGIASAATHAYRLKGVPMFRNQNIKAGFLDDRDLLFIAPEYEIAFKNKRLRKGDLLTMRTGYPGVTAIVPRQYDSAQSFTTLITRPRQHEVESAYLCHFINSELGQKFFTQSQIGGAQKNVNAGTLRGMPVPVPSIREQRAIAAALSDVDALLDGLERLIAKKRDLKQAAMQQLLIGQTRLPGFRGEWEVKRLGELGSTYGGLTGKTKADFGDGEGQYVTFMGVMTNVVIDSAQFERVRVFASESQNYVRRGDLLLNGSSETPEEVAMCSLMAEEVPNLFLNSFCFGFRLRDETQADGLFLAYLIRSFEGRELMKSLAQGSTRYNISKGALLAASIKLPSRDEQIAIAAVLSDMDAELSALEARRDKTRNLKQAMMQELLTGRTRLV